MMVHVDVYTGCTGSVYVYTVRVVIYAGQKFMLIC